MVKTKEKAVKPKKTEKTPTSKPLAHAVGRRKTSVARVWIRRGQGAIIVNGKPVQEYFDTAIATNNAATPYRVVPVSSSYNAEITVAGGGKVSQSDAVKLAISRALLSMDEALRPVLRKHDLLTVDDRQKERKKYGQKAARRKFQFVKR